MAAITMSMSWTDSGTSFRMDVVAFFLALALHAPLYFMKFDTHKKVIDRPTTRLVSVDLIDPEAEKKVAPPPPVVKKEDSGLLDKLKALVRSEPPPPPKPVKPAQPAELKAPDPIQLQAKLNTPGKIESRIQDKGAFKTAADPTLVKEQQIALKAGGPLSAPLSANKVGVVENRAALKDDRGSFQVAKAEALKGIGGGPAIADPAAPAIAIRTGSGGSTEKFSAAPAMADKGKLGAVGVPGVGGPKLGLRDSIIARDAKPAAIGSTGSGSGSVAGLGQPAASKQDAGRFEGGTPGGTGLARAGVGIGGAPAVAAAAPKTAPAAKKKEKKSMFVITGPLKDRPIERQVLPEYPDWALARGIEASVVLQFTVTPSGSVKDAIVVRRTSGYPRLDQGAIEALRKWKFAPIAGDENREEVGLITLNYSLS